MNTKHTESDASNPEAVSPSSKADEAHSALETVRLVDSMSRRPSFSEQMAELARLTDQE